MAEINFGDLTRRAQAAAEGDVKPRDFRAELIRRQRMRALDVPIGVGRIGAPDITSLLLGEPDIYGKRLQAAGGSIGPGGTLVPPPSGKLPSTDDPRIPGAAYDIANIASSFIPAGAATKGGMLAAAILPGARRALKPSAFKLLSGPEAAQKFHDAVKAIKDVHPQGASVTLKDVKDYAQEGTKLFVTKDNKATMAVMPDGDVVSVAKHPDAPYSGVGTAAAKRGVKEGGTKLDAYDTVLPDMYGKAGYKEVARLPFDPRQAPSDWRTADFAAFPGKTPTAASRMKNLKIGGPGEPDIVGMVANPPGKTAGVATRYWDDMMNLQRLAQEGRHPAQFVNNPIRSYFPKVYDDPATVVREAAARVGIAPRWSGMTGALGMNPVGAQGLGWTAFAPRTGVKTAVGAPKLEIESTNIGRRVEDLAKRGITKSPEQVRDEGLLGLEHWMLGATVPLGLGATSDWWGAPPAEDEPLRITVRPPSRT